MSEEKARAAIEQAHTLILRRPPSAARKEAFQTLREARESFAKGFWRQATRLARRA